MRAPVARLLHSEHLCTVFVPSPGPRQRHQHTDYGQVVVLFLELPASQCVGSAVLLALYLLSC